jgi:plasmid stabilization system protein ParE
MTYRVFVQPSAQGEMEAAYEWAARRAPVTAARWYNRLMEAIGSLDSSPQRCPLAPENEYFREEIRNLLFGRAPNVFRILFTIRDDTVHVLHFRRAGRKVIVPDPEPESE